MSAEAVPGWPTAKSRAGFSSCGRYRYTLVRTWDVDAGRVCFCMLNPSTADASKNDPTVRRAVGYALDWGYGSIEIVNIFGLRSTDPQGLYKLEDPIGLSNNAALRRAFRRADTIVCAWGSHGALHNRSAHVRAMLRREHVSAHCLGVTNAGEPKHPLYIAKSVELQGYV